MGQRVQLLIDAEVMNSDSVVIKRACYHNQWGIGKNIWKDVIILLLRNLRADTREIGFPSMLCGGSDISKTDDIEEDLYKLNFDSVDAIKDFVLNNCDMDDGVVVLKITTDSYGYIEKGSIRIFDDEFNELSYDAWYDVCSSRKYQDEDFDAALKHMFNMYNITYKERGDCEKFKLTTEQSEKLKNYPYLQKYVMEYIDNNGKSTESGCISSLVFFFKMMCLNHGLNEAELFNWSDAYQNEFYSWGSNSRWAAAFSTYLYLDFSNYIDIALDLVEQYGDTDIYK